jgi:hypothetical protein
MEDLIERLHNLTINRGKRRHPKVEDGIEDLEDVVERLHNLTITGGKHGHPNLKDKIADRYIKSLIDDLPMLFFRIDKSQYDEPNVKVIMDEHKNMMRELKGIKTSPNTDTFSHIIEWRNKLFRLILCMYPIEKTFTFWVPNTIGRLFYHELTYLRLCEPFQRVRDSDLRHVEVPKDGYVDLYPICNEVLNELSDRRSTLLLSMRYEEWLQAYEALQQCLTKTNFEKRLNRVINIEDEAARMGITHDTTLRVQYYEPINECLQKMNDFIDECTLYYEFIEAHEQ